MRITEIAFTGYPVTDMPRARAFYEGILGLTVSRTWGEDANPQWVEYDVGAGCLAIVTGGGENWQPANNGPAAALEVDDFRGFVDRLEQAKVKFQWEPQESPVCWMAVVLDPDENRVVIHQRKNPPAAI
jgi:catechol 2,3-dioxygenase-like lactoylglutathione lyase family enzyme